MVHGLAEDGRDLPPRRLAVEPLELDAQDAQTRSSSTRNGSTGPGSASASVLTVTISTMFPWRMLWLRKASSCRLAGSIHCRSSMMNTVGRSAATRSTTRSSASKSRSRWSSLPPRACRRWARDLPDLRDELRQLRARRPQQRLQLARLELTHELTDDLGEGQVGEACTVDQAMTAQDPYAWAQSGGGLVDEAGLAGAALAADHDDLWPPSPMSSTIERMEASSPGVRRALGSRRAPRLPWAHGATWAVAGKADANE